MKYIDAEKLIAEIRKLRSESCISESDDYYEYAKSEIIDIITSLQQEQPKFRIGDTIHKKGENTVFPMTIERISDGDYVCDGGKCFVSIKFQDNYELIQQEQPEVDLEKEIIRYQREDMDRDTTVGDVARHFAEWGAIHLNARKADS